jgi:hypothetical protein
MERKGMSRQKRENLAGHRKQSVKVHGPEPLTPSKDRSSKIAPVKVAMALFFWYLSLRTDCCDALGLTSQ